MKTLSALIFFTIGWMMVFGQDNPPQVIPPTPNVASLGKYGSTSVGLYTGQPKVTFPIHTIQYPDFKFPIALDYSYNGLRPEEYPGWVGMGWALQATGVITRQTRGIADERLYGYNGYYKKGLEVVSFINNSMNTSLPAFQGLLNGLKDGYMDGEPDLFVLSAPGLSGKFFFDESQCNSQIMEGNLVIKEAVMIPFSKIKVKGFFDYTAKYSTATGIIKKFEVTNEQGVKYLFDVMEKSANILQDIDNGNASSDFGNAWYLSRITTPFNNEIIFQYRFRILDNPATVTEEMLLPENFNSTPQYYATSTTEAVLTSISFRNGFINFVEETTPRADWNSLNWTYSRKQATEQPKALDKISIQVGNGLLKEIDLTYNYLGGSRLILESIQEKNGATTMPPTRFEYQSGIVPAIGNHSQLFNQDHWGYYSGTDNTTLLTPFFGSGSGTLGAFSFSFTGNLRLPNEALSKTGVLNKITYPTGGTSNFEYEPNDFYSDVPVSFLPPRGDFTNMATATAVTGLGLGESELRQTFTLTSLTYGKIDFSLQVANCGEGTATVRVLKKATQEQVLGYHLYRSPNGIDPVQYLGPEPNTVFVLEAGQYEVVANASIESTCTVSITQPARSSITYKAWIPDLSGANYMAGGMRVKKITDCDQGQTSGCVKQNFAYFDPAASQKSSGILISEPIYSHDLTLIKSNGSTIYTYNGKVLRANSFVPVANTQGSTIGYKYVTVTTDDAASQGKTLHNFTSAAEYKDIVYDKYPFPMNVSNDWKRGSEVFMKNHNPSAQVVKETQTTSTPSTYYNRKIAVQTVPKIKLLDMAGVDYSLQITDYYYNSYDLISGKMELTSETRSSNENGVSLTTISNYSYENPTHLQVTKIESKNSKGDLLTTTLKYPDDVGSVAGLTSTETTGIQNATNRTAVIEKRNSINGVVQETMRSLYDGPKLMRVLKSTEARTLEEVLSINTYDFYGSVLNYTTRQGENASYVYDLLSINPIAEVKNSGLSNIFFTSFEDSGFDYNNDGHAGTRSKNGFSKGLINLTPGSYVLSYWTKQSGQWNYVSSDVNVAGATYTINVTGQIDDVRFHPKNAIMSTYTYDVNGRVSSISDANSRLTYYEYDTLGRLISIRDDSKSIVKSFSYNFHQN